METEMTNENGVSGEHVKCPSCAAEMVYSPEENMLICPYCGSRREIAVSDAAIEEHAFENSQSRPEEWGVSTKVIHCSNCGANMVAESNITAQVCAYCGSPMISQSENADSVPPESLIPFKISSDTAKQYFKDWVKSRFYAPRALREQNRLQERLRGVYVPHFTYDCNTESDYHAQAGTHYYSTEMVSVMRDGKSVMESRAVTRTSWAPVSGHFSHGFDDVLILASKNIDDNLIRLEYNLKELVPYQKEYLYSFLAENNSISREDCWKSAQGVIERNLRDKIRGSIAADEVKDLTFSTSYRNITFKSVLLPVWISSYLFKGKTYRFMVNGQSGEVKGNSPVSGLRVFLSILVALIVTGFCFALNPLLGGVAMVASAMILFHLGSRKPKKDKKKG